jgi:hypothetical protein
VKRDAQVGQRVGIYNWQAECAPPLGLSSPETIAHVVIERDIRVNFFTDDSGVFGEFSGKHLEIKKQGRRENITALTERIRRMLHIAWDG